MSFWVSVPHATAKAPGPGAEPVVYYLVEVGVQAGAGQQTSRRTVLRRYSDFRVLASRLRAALPGKALPEVPPKRRFVRVNESAALVDERRRKLEAWLWKLLADVEIAHSAPLVAFLELGAARHALEQQQRERQQQDAQPQDGVAAAAAAEGDTATAHGGDDLESDGEPDYDDAASERSGSSAARSSVDGAGVASTSAASGLGSDVSAAGSDVDLQALAARALAPPAQPRSSSTDGVATRLGMRMEQRASVKRLVSVLRKRYEAMKADLEDALACLKSESAVKELLAAKVEELEANAQRAKHETAAAVALAVGAERERATALGWELEEAQGATRAAEEATRREAAGRAEAEARAEAAAVAARDEARAALQAADSKAYSEKKVLSKEIKSLRKQLAERAAAADAAGTTRAVLETRLADFERRDAAETASVARVLKEVDNLRGKLQECSVEALSTSEGARLQEGDVPTDPLELLSLSDNRVACLLAEASLLGSSEDGDVAAPLDDDTGGPPRREAQLRRKFADVLVHATQLARVNNSLLRNALAMGAAANGVVPADAPAPQKPQRGALAALLGRT